MNTSPASGASSSKIVVTSSAAFADGDKVSVLIVGSDTSEKY